MDNQLIYGTFVESLPGQSNYMILNSEFSVIVNKTTKNDGVRNIMEDYLQYGDDLTEDPQPAILGLQ